MEKEEILEVLQRWESTGLLTGLPPWEKEELALLYDNVTRVMLSKANQLYDNVYETLGDVTLPTTRRLYRRVGINFEINTMVDELTRRVEENYEAINVPPNKDDAGNLVNPIVEFCVEFADTYFDGQTEKHMLTSEEYSDVIDKMLKIVKEVLINDKMVSFIDTTSSDWCVMYSDTKKTPNQTRIWNQKRATESFNGILNNINQNNL